MYLDTIVLFQVRDVPVGTIMVGDVVHQRTHAGTERETAMVLLMEELMMDIRVVREIWCVAATTARSLVSTITRRTTVVTFLRLSLPQLLLLNHCQEFPWNLLQVKLGIQSACTKNIFFNFNNRSKMLW